MRLLGALPKVTLFSFGLVLSSALLIAAEKGLPGSKPGVQLKIGTILASNQSQDFDPRLSKMKNQLKVFKYRSYRLINEEIQDVPWQANALFSIPGGRSLVVVPQEYRDRQVSLKVRLLERDKPLLDTSVRLRNRGNLLLGGPVHEGGVLILSIWAMAE